ncbi:histidine phosphatase family protein, partial [Candidatus Kaiserbacteria bacterium]|nr:histidine phosphatase family protein [Candidatus Kaiserbacteria bacterium]
MTREIPGRQFPEWVGGRKRLNEMLGKNVEVLATFMRHSYRASEDDPKAALSAEGVVQAQQIGEKFAPRKSGAFLRSSPSGRARETAGEIRAGISKRSTSRTSEIRARPELGSVSSDERFHEIWVAKSTEYLREHVPDLTTLSFDEQQQATREADDEVIDSWFRGESEWSTVATPRSVAARMAVILSRVLEMPKKMWNMSSVDNIFVSHKPNFEALLREIIVRSEKNAHAGAEQTVRGFESVKEIGG